jgi:hypothetical protein
MRQASALGADNGERAAGEEAEGQKEEAADAVQGLFEASERHDVVPFLCVRRQGELAAVYFGGSGGADGRSDLDIA